MGQAVCLELHTHNLTKPPTALGDGHGQALHVTEQESEAQASDCLSKVTQTISRRAGTQTQPRASSKPTVHPLLPQLDMSHQSSAGLVLSSPRPVPITQRKTSQ